MIIEIIATGDEVLTGFTVDTNSSWLSQRLLDHGWQVRRRHTVGDRMDDLVAILQERSQVADILLVNGGLGPTSDDKTTEAAALAADVPLQLDQTWLDLLLERYAGRGRPMPESNRKQALLPANAERIHNPVGTACGFKMPLNRATCYFTPGVPSEFKVMVDEQILPQLVGSQSGQARVDRFFTFGVSESALSDRLDTLAWPDDIVLGYRSSMPIIELKLISQQANAIAFDQARTQLLQVIEPFLVGEDHLDQPAAIAHLLEGRRLTIQEDGTRGLVLHNLAPRLPQLQGHLQPLPQTLEALYAATIPPADSQSVTLAIGGSSEQGIPLVLRLGEQAWGQTLRSSLHNPPLRTAVIAFAAQEMIRRALLGHAVLGPYETLARHETLAR